MKKKLTLLIALSITVATIVGSLIMPIVASETIETEIVSSEDAEPVVPMGAEEIVEEEPIIAETPIPEEPIETVVEESAPIVEPEPAPAQAIPEGDYAVATQVWNIMKSFGWSDIICAGILGNMMRECGGDTLNLNPYAQNSHYGLCQWSGRYHPGAWGKDVAGQLEYLRSTLNLSIFDNCTTPEQVAETFCWSYERPSRSDPVYKRAANAATAYNYFVK